MFKFKSTALLSACLAAASIANAQGWVTNGNNRLYPVNSALSTAPVQVGIGTSTPTAMLHTIGSLRFQGLGKNDAFTRVMVTDTSGNVAYRDAATLGTGTGTPAWNLTGNTGTVPGTHFIGTTDSKGLVFKTGNVERMKILSDGNVGIGTKDAVFKLQIYSSADDKKLAVTGSAPSLRLWGPTQTNPAYGAVFGLATADKNYATTSKPGDLVLGPVTSNAIIFNTNINNYAYIPSDEKMRIGADGNVGVNTPIPSAKLHVNGTVRLENLPQGYGNNLVVDADGNLFVQSATYQTTSIASNESSEVQTLKRELAQLRSELDELRAMMRSGGSVESGKAAENAEAWLAVNVPNPFSNETTISYSLPERPFSRASIRIADLNGKILNTYNLGTTSGQVTVKAPGSAGTYLYSLEIDGKHVTSKKMIVSK